MALSSCLSNREISSGISSSSSSSASNTGNSKLGEGIGLLHSMGLSLVNLHMLFIFILENLLMQECMQIFFGKSFFFLFWFYFGFLGLPFPEKAKIKHIM